MTSVVAAKSRASALYVGETVHSRRKPALNRFVYSIFMGYLDLAEIQAGAVDCWPVFSSRTPWAFTSLLERDHLTMHSTREYTFSSDATLSERVRTIVEVRTGIRPDGPIRLLAGLRVFGLEFNPVSFFYILSKDESTLDFLVAEVNNIPWFEQHLYVLSPYRESQVDKPLDDAIQPAYGHDVHMVSSGAKLKRFSSHKKAFHVSPFMPIEGIEYDWLVGIPEAHLKLRICLKQEDASIFMASLDMARRPFNILQILWLLITYPLMTITVVLGIMYEAAKLWMHGAFTFHPHPEGAETTSSKSIAACIATFSSAQQALARKDA